MVLLNSSTCNFDWKPDNFNFTSLQEEENSFYNLSGDSKLIIPIPKKGKYFTTIKDFIDTASLTQQKQFWKYAAEEIIDTLNHESKIYISTHGLGIPYFHLRLDTRPKYYQSQNFIN